MQEQIKVPLGDLTKSPKEIFLEHESSKSLESQGKLFWTEEDLQEFEKTKAIGYFLATALHAEKLNNFLKKRQIFFKN